MAAAVPPICDFGWKAEDARLPGTYGQTHSILDQAGQNGLLVAFICNHCPYVIAVIDRMVHEANALKEHGIGFVAISSNDVQTYPQDSPEKMVEFAKAYALPFHYLYDESQDIARAYGAVCTPDFFGFNANMELQYRGRLDDSRQKGTGADVQRDLFNAMVAVAKTGQGPQDQIPSMGCSIKWK